MKSSTEVLLLLTANAYFNVGKWHACNKSDILDNKGILPEHQLIYRTSWLIANHTSYHLVRKQDYSCYNGLVVWQLAQVVLIRLRTVDTKELHSNNHLVLGVHALFHLDHKYR